MFKRIEFHVKKRASEVGKQTALELLKTKGLNAGVFRFAQKHPTPNQ